MKYKDRQLLFSLLFFIAAQSVRSDLASFLYLGTLIHGLGFIAAELFDLFVHFKAAQETYLEMKKAKQEAGG